MEAFDTAQDEVLYLRWLTANPAGFVVNCHRPKPNRHYLILHSALCWTIGKNAAGGGRLTGNYYQKVCSADRASLDQWAEAIGGALTPCGTCQGNPSTATRAKPLPAASKAPVKGSGESLGPATRLPAGTKFRRWRMGEPLVELRDLQPRLASWDAKTNQNQVNLQAYVDDIEQRLATVELPAEGLFVDLTVDIGEPSKLLVLRDLENYLTPLVKRLGRNRFVYARGVKQSGGGSSLRVGVAMPGNAPADEPFETTLLEPTGNSNRASWKQGIQDALVRDGFGELPPGPVAVSLTWRCGPERNWVDLWKPTGDAMGPVLGWAASGGPFNVNDDRITELELHRDADETMGNRIQVEMSWRSGPA